MNDTRMFCALALVMFASYAFGADGVNSRPAVSSDALIAEMKAHVERVAKIPYPIEPPDVISITGSRLMPRELGTLQGSGLLTNRALRLGRTSIFQGDSSADLLGVSRFVGEQRGELRPVADETVAQHQYLIRSGIAMWDPDAKAPVPLLVRAETKVIFGNHLVGMDGYVDLGPFGSAFVAGMNVTEASVSIERKLAEVCDDPKVTVTVAEYHSKVVYLVCLAPRIGSGVTRYEYPFPVSADTNVAWILTQKYARLPPGAPLRDLATAKIWLRRRYGQEANQFHEYPVQWDHGAIGPSKKTNYPLIPMDQVLVKFPDDEKPRAAVAGEQ